MIHERMGTYRAKTSSVKQLGYERSGRKVAEGLGSVGPGARILSVTPWRLGEKQAPRGKHRTEGDGVGSQISIGHTVAPGRETRPTGKASHGGHGGHGGGLGLVAKMLSVTPWRLGEKHVPRRKQRKESQGTPVAPVWKEAQRGRLRQGKAYRPRDRMVVSFWPAPVKIEHA
jgi:hypothetical protein